jgi:hypothetical protein
MKLPSNQQRSQSVKSEKASSHLEQINHNAAGIDLGGFEHWVCVAPDKAEKNVRRFGCFTPDLIAIIKAIARMFYYMWTTTGLYTDPGMDYYEKKYNEQVLKNLRKKAHALGLELVALPQEPPLAPFSQSLVT